jgi:hypothetical protein
MAQIRFCKSSDGARIAYAQDGRGAGRPTLTRSGPQSPKNGSASYHRIAFARCYSGGRLLALRYKSTGGSIGGKNRGRYYRRGSGWPGRRRVFAVILDFALGNLSRYGITRPRQGILEQIDKAAKIPVLDIGTAKRIQEGKIKVRPGVSAITADSVIFDDGEKSRFDAIILATGYRPSYQDFLGANEVRDGGALPVNVPPTMFFAGFRNPVTGLLHDISKEAKKVARDIARPPQRVRKFTAS